MKNGLAFILFLIALSSICDTLNQLFLKSAVNSLSAPANRVKEVIRFILKLVRTPRVWAGLLFSLISLCVWLFVLSRADLSFAFSADSMHYIFIALTSWLVLKERVSFKRWMGIALIVAGIALVSLS